MLRALHVERFRNLTQASVALGPGLNLFIGPNGAGKTALLEAAYTLARSRSFRSRKASDVIQHGRSDLLVRGEFESPRGNWRAGLIKRRGGGTDLHIDGAKERKLSEIARRFPVQLMLPGVSELVFGGPGLRRQLLDWGVFHVKPSYASEAQTYGRCLKQRNALLKAARDPGQLGPDFATWSQQLIDAAGRLTESRRQYLEEWEPQIQQALGELSDGLGVRTTFLPGHSNLAGDGAENGVDPVDSLAKILSENLPREVKYGATQAGPHRADLLLKVGGERAASVMSRGQGKTLALAMLVGQARHLVGESGLASTFLIDDVGAELDQVHNRNFYSLLHQMGCQVLATSTELPNLGEGYPRDTVRVFHVEHGVVSPDPGD